MKTKAEGKLRRKAPPESSHESTPEGLTGDKDDPGLGPVDPTRRRFLLGTRSATAAPMLAASAEFPRLSMKRQFLDCLSNIVRQKPATSYDNFLRVVGTQYAKGYTALTFADLYENAPFTE